MPLAVAAVGGNAIASLADLAPVPGKLAALVSSGWHLVVTHGNGPQVGERLLAAQARPQVTPPSLDVLDAETQGSMGYLLQQGLENALLRAHIPRPVAAVLTRVEVDPADPAFAEPTKPVGPFYDAAQAERLRREKGWVVKEDAGRGYRRVVPSPRPRAIVDGGVVRSLLASGWLVVAAGGGGIPVVRQRDGTFEGIDAVIDKDRTSSLLARGLDADLLLILTGVSEIALDFGKPTARPVASLTVGEAQRHLEDGQFPAGSMGPKVEAAIEFVSATGRRAIITSAEAALRAVAGQAGTRIVPGG